MSRGRKSFTPEFKDEAVKMVMDYTEELTAGNPRHAAIIKIKTGVKKNGVTKVTFQTFVNVL